MNRPSPLRRSHAITLHFDLNDFSEENQEILSNSGSFESIDKTHPFFEKIEEDDLFDIEDDINDISEFTQFNNFNTLKTFSPLSNENSEEDDDLEHFNDIKNITFYNYDNCDNYNVENSETTNDNNELQRKSSVQKDDVYQSHLFDGSSFLFTYQLNDNDVQMNFSRSYSEQDEDIFAFE